jgi:hypothetical protein
MHPSSSSRPSATKLLHWVEGIATAIALVTVPPEGGIYYGQAYLVWSSEDADYGSHRLFLPYLGRGATDDRDESVLGPNDLISTLGEKPSTSSALCPQKLRPDDDIAPMLMCPY